MPDSSGCVRQAAPKRSIICIVATLSAFLLAALFALVMTWWRRNHASFAHRLQRAVAAPDTEKTVTS